MPDETPANPNALPLTEEHKKAIRRLNPQNVLEILPPNDTHYVHKNRIHEGQTVFTPKDVVERELGNPTPTDEPLDQPGPPVNPAKKLAGFVPPKPAQ
jgi:hypothetical protein